MDFELTAAMMYANYGNIEKEVKGLDEGGIFARAIRFISIPKWNITLQPPYLE